VHERGCVPVVRTLGDELAPLVPDPARPESFMLACLNPQIGSPSEPLTARAEYVCARPSAVLPMLHHS
jgi:hypothetical protein